jgi:hypothetical protein
VTASHAPEQPTPTPSTTPAGKPTPKPIPTPTPVPAKPPSFNDWPTYGYDNRHDGFNPNSSAITPASLAQLHLAWQADLGDYNTQTQPIVATNVAGHQAVLIVGGGSGAVSGYDALSGALLWRRQLGQQRFTCSDGTAGWFGIGGTAVYDPASKSVYVADDQNQVVNGPSQLLVYRLDAGTGAGATAVNLTPSPLPGELDFSHTALTLSSNGLLYAGTGSTCDISFWRGSIIAMDTQSLSLNTFYTTYGLGGNYSGGGVWSWGGVSIDDSGNVYAGVGNADTSPASPTPSFTTATSEQVGYAEHVVKLSANLSTVLGANYPGFTFDNNASNDLDFSGTPILFQPIGCHLLSASQGKSGQLIIYDTQAISQPSAPLARFQFSVSSSEAAYIGNPGYSPVTGLLYATVNSQQGGSIRPPGLVAIDASGCGAPSIVWSAQFGPDSFAYGANPRSAPTATFGGVVLVGTPCTPMSDGTCGAPGGASGGAVWAIDARLGTVLNGGKPILTTGAHVRMAPVVDGDWIWVLDNGGDLYGLTIDPNYKAIANVRRMKAERQILHWR